MTVLVLQLAVILISAKIIGYLFQRFLRQPRVLGELVAGMIIGPYALGQFFIPLIGQPLFPIGEGVLPVSPELYGFASVASIVLLFLAGLETDLPTFLRFSVVGSLVGLGGAAVAYLAGSGVAIWLFPGVDGFLHPVALFLGVLSTATSVGITARILSDKREMSSPEGVSILSAAVLDDVIGIILLAVVVGIVRAEGAAGQIDWGQIGIIAGKAFGFWLSFTVIGILLAPKLIKGLKVFRSMDVLAGTTFGIALFLSGLSETAGLAMIIGAYVTGLSLSQTDIAHQLRERLSGLYDFLVPVFFCVMGMLVDFSAFASVVGFGLLYAAAAILGKILGCGVPALFTGFNLKGALRIGLGMLPRGEVSLIIAGIGLSTGAIPAELFGVAVLTMLISTVAAPPLIIKSFDGTPGYVAKRGARAATAENQRVVTLELPTALTAEFFRRRILQSFRNEEYFVNRIDFENEIYQIRQEDAIITLTQSGNTIHVQTDAENESFVRFLMAEEIVELRDLLEGLEKMNKQGDMGQNLLGGILD